nr:uncharacterized protein LOC100186940 [Ciona intestinalis]|eukprot:XP_002125445.1 uncharacterized protein LOC100186940 [Ciona intestinalis]
MIRKIKLLVRRAARFGLFASFAFVTCTMLLVATGYSRNPFMVSKNTRELEKVEVTREAGYLRKPLSPEVSDVEDATPDVAPVKEDVLESEDEFMKRIEKRMRKRREHLQQACERLGLQPNKTDGHILDHLPRPMPWSFVSNKHKLMYCEIPKSGCTNWKKVLMVLNGVLNNTDNIKQGEAHTKSLQMLRMMPNAERKRFYEAATKLLVVRQPFERLVSAYADKVAAKPPANDSVFFQFSSEVAKKYGRRQIDSDTTILNDGTRSTTVCSLNQAHLECSSPGDVINIVSASYGRWDNVTCVPEGVHAPLQMCRIPGVKEISSQICNGKKLCQVVASKAQFLRSTLCDQTPSYLTINYQCLNLNNAEVVTVCQPEIRTIQCQPNYSINILSALYGRIQDTSTCAKGRAIYNLQCSSDTATASVSSACNNQNSCQIQATAKWVQSDGCPATSKYLRVWYVCKPDKITRRRRAAEAPRKKHLKLIKPEDPLKKDTTDVTTGAAALEPPDIYKQPVYIYRHLPLHATFDEFVAYLIDPANKDVTSDNIYHGKETLKSTSVRHWQSFLTLCHPCHIKYDVIAHMDTIAEDSRYILKRIGAPEDLEYPKGYHSTGASGTSIHSMSQHFSQLSLNAIQQLYKLYKPDFDLFGFPEPNEVKLVNEFLKNR